MKHQGILTEDQVLQVVWRLQAISLRASRAVENQAASTDTRAMPLTDALEGIQDDILKAYRVLAGVVL